MGAGASLGDQMLNEEPEGSQTSQRYFCHECRQITRARNTSVCGACNSSFIESLEGSSAESAMSMVGGGNSMFRSREGGGEGGEGSSGSRRDMNLSQDQSRRLANAAIMLRLLERQLQGELESIQAQYRQAQAEHEAQQCMSPVMKRKLRRPKADVDMIVAQPSCPICSEDFVVEGEVLALPCNHIFCEACVVPWLDMKKTCPICRFELNNDLPSVTDLEKHTREELISMLEEEKKEYAEEERARKVKQASDDMEGEANEDTTKDEDLSLSLEGKEIINKTKIAKDIIEVMQRRRTAVDKEKGMIENDRMRELRERERHPRVGGFRTAQERAANPSPSNRTLREVIEEGERESARENAERRERMRALGILPAAEATGVGNAENGTAGTLPTTRAPTTVGANPASRDDFSRVLAAILQSTNMGLGINDDSESDDDDNPFLSRRIGSSIDNSSVNADVTEARTNLQNARSSLASAREENTRLEAMRVIPVGGSVRSSNAPTTFVIRSNGDAGSMQIERRQALREAIDSID